MKLTSAEKASKDSKKLSWSGVSSIW